MGSYSDIGITSIIGDGIRSLSSSPFPPSLVTFRFAVDARLWHAPDISGITLGKPSSLGRLFCCLIDKDPSAAESEKWPLTALDEG